MSKSERRILLYCLSMCLATCGSIFYWLSRQEKKIAVVDAVKLFDSYGMKADLEAIAKKELLAESKKLDSADKALQMARAMNVSEEELKKMAYGYNFLKNDLERHYTESNHDINEKVWKRLNPLLDEFGRKNKLHVIIGANGMGSVLYNDAFYDRTNEAIIFVNGKYAEGN